MANPAVGRAPRSARLRAPVLTGVGVGVAGGLAALADPERRTLVICPLHVITGLWCPACGALRATTALVRLDIAHAWAMNPLWTAVIPFIVAGWLVWLVRSWQGRPMPQVSTRSWVGFLVVLLVFGVLRNVPALHGWLGPHA